MDELFYSYGTILAVSLRALSKGGSSRSGLVESVVKREVAHVGAGSEILNLKHPYLHFSLTWIRLGYDDRSLYYVSLPCVFAIFTAHCVCVTSIHLIQIKISACPSSLCTVCG